VPAVSRPRTARLSITPIRFGDWTDFTGRVARYEALGFDTVWIPDHFVFPWDPSQPWFDGWAALAALAALTTRIRIGSMVTHVAFRNPAVLARTAMTVDQISNGRLELGFGLGASGYDWTMPSGIDPWPMGERVERLIEALAIVDGLLRGSLSTYRGRYYRVEGAVLAPGPVQRPRPRLVLAASGPRMVKLAARHADAWATEGWFRELPGDATPTDVLRLAGDRCRLLVEEATALGRNAAEVGRIFVAGFGPASRGRGVLRRRRRT